MSQKIQGKFYPLKSEEWLNSINKLTHSELKILYYVRSLDPYNNGINLTPAQIAKDLSTDKAKMHRSTVGRALKSLDRQGFINMELLQVRIKVNPKGFLAEEETTESKNVVATQQCCDHATQSAATQHRVQPRNIECSHATQNAATQQLKSETQSEQEVQNPKIIKTYSEFKRSLSEDERENFLNFVEEKIRNLEKPINDIEAWLASKNAANQNRWEVYYSNYQERKIKERSRCNKHDLGSASLTPAQKKQAIANFQNRHNLKNPEIESDEAEILQQKELEAKQRAIAEFQERMNRDAQSSDEPEETDSEEYRQQEAAFNELLSNPPERDQSLAQERREAINKAKQEREEIARANKEAASARAKEQNPDLEQRRLEMLRQIEEFNQRRQRQNPEINPEDKPEIDPENPENE
jgi:hypothetical protein